MKRILTFCLLASVFIGCSKEGPAGKDGVNGSNGKDGVNGISGKDGTFIYSGQSSPASSIGALGDFYIDLSLGVLFGPKTNSGWGTGTSMKGSDGTNGTNGKDGENGTDGATILSGYGYPQSLIGVQGDFYIDLSNSILYGPKDSTTWPDIGLSIKGRDGNANVRSYVLTNPWKFYDDSNPTNGLFYIPNETGGLRITDMEAKYGLILVYLKSYTDASISSEYALASGGRFGMSSFSAGSSLAFLFDNSLSGINIFIRKGVLQQTWTDLDDAKNTTGIEEIKIVIIPQSFLTFMGINKNKLNEENLKMITESISN